MPRWHNLAFASAMIAVAAPAAADDLPGMALVPASQASIIEAARACLGATVEPDVRPDRFTGWVPATPEQRRAIGDEPTVVTKNNVLVAYKKGKDGGCIVLAHSDAAFDPATFYTQLGATVNATLVKTDNPVPVALPDGETVLPVFIAESPSGSPNIIIVFDSHSGQSAKKGN